MQYLQTQQRIRKSIQSVVALLLLCALTITSFETPIAAAAPNPEINYQGKLTNTSGAAVADDDYTMTFRLYTVSTGGSAIWTENRTVDVLNGLFSVMLGSTTPLTSVDFNQTLYLGVTIAPDNEMTPRKVLGTVPAAFEADRLDGIEASQFVRNDATSSIATTSGDTLLSITQSGAGDILNLFDDTDEVFTVTDGGLVGIGSSTPAARLSVGGDSYFGGNVTATGSITFTGITNGLLLADGSGILSATSSFDISAYTNLGVTATGLELSGDDIALTSGYTIPLTASTTEWANAATQSHDAVTLAGEDFLSLGGQEITANAINPDNLASADFGDFSCNGTTCSFDGSTVSDNEIDYATVTLNDFINDANFIDLTDLSSTEPALTYNNTNGQFSLTSGYTIPLTASTTDWQTAYSWGDHSTAGYLLATNNLSDLTSSSTARTNLGVDPAGTDNSTDVTLAGSYDYLSLAGQEITLNQIDLATDVTGTLTVAKGGSGATSLTGLLLGNGTSAFTATTTLSQNYGGTGISSYTAGDLLYADDDGNLARLPAGSAGQVLKVTSGLPAWGADNAGGGGGSGLWATSSAGLITYPSDTSDIILVGSSATSSDTSIFEVQNGNAFFEENVSVGTTTADARFSIQSMGTDDILNLFETSGAEVFTVLENGNVGISTTSPTYSLTVSGDTNQTGALRFNGDAGTTGYILQSTGSGAPSWVATSSLGFTDTNTQLTQEQVEDFTGGMVSGNTETLITVTYQDADGTLDFVVDNDLANYDNSNTNFIDLTDLSSTEPALTYTNTTGVFSLTSGYTIPLTASTTDWQTAYSWGDHSTQNYFDLDNAPLSVPNGGSGATTLTGLLLGNGTSAFTATTTLSSSYIEDVYVLNTGDTMTGTLILPNTGLQIGTSVPFSDSTGTLTLQNVDAIDATTESTIEAAIDTLANLTSASSLATIGTITTGVWNGTAIDFSTYTNATAGAGITFTGDEISADLGDSVDISDETNLGVTATGLELVGDNIALTSGYTIPLTASTTDWNTFYTTPSDRITAGTDLSWSGNTLNFNNTSGYITGNETITLSGDVTGSGTTSIATALATNSVSDNEIDYTNVTLNDFTFDVNSVSKTEFGYLNGVTSAIQTQLDTKLENINNESLEDLSDVASFTQNTGDILYWTGSAWNVTATSTWDTDTTLTQEQVEDFTGGMVSGNTETLITVTYQDADGTLDFVVDNDLANYDNSNTNFIDLTDLSSTEPALTYTNTTGVFSLTSGYTIPLTASTTDWQTAYSWGDHSTQNYFDLDNAPLSVPNGGSGATTLTGLLLGNGTSAFTATTTLSSSYIEDVYLRNDGDTASGDYDFDSGTLFVDAANNRVGIGTTSPDVPLTIVGTVNQMFNVESNNTAGTAFSLINDSSGANFQLAGTGSANGYGGGHFSFWNQTLGQAPLILNANGNVRIGHDGGYTATAASTLSMYGNASIGASYVGTAAPSNGLIVEGNVGIGTTTPGEALVVDGNIYATGDITCGGSCGGGSSIWEENGSDIYYTSGNVGIGTTSPSNLLSLEGGGITFEDGGIDGGISRGIQGKNAVEQILFRNTGDITFDTTSIERMRIDPSGNVGIGTTTPTELLHVAGDTRIEGRIYDNANSAGAMGALLQSTGTGFEWTATSSLGVGDGTFLGLSDTPASYTAGGVLFMSASGVTHDSSKFYWDDGSDRLAIGHNSFSGLPSGTDLGVISSDSTTARLTVANTNGTDVIGIFDARNDGVAALQFGSTSAHPLNFFTSGAQQMTILADGNVGIGTSSPNSKLHINNTLTSTAGGQIYNVLNEMYLDASGTSTNIFIGDRSTVETLSANDSDYNILIASAPRVFHNGNGTVSDARGVNLVMRNTGAGTITSGVGGYFQLANASTGSYGSGYAGRFQFSNTNVGGLITNAYGAYIDGVNSGTITNTYGLYIADVTSGTQTNTPFSIYSSDAESLNYFAGDVGIGVTDPDKRLEVFDTVADAQLKLSYDATRYAQFQVDSVGDLLITAQGSDVRISDDNLWVCESGSCPSVTASSTGGYVVAENGYYFGNGMKIDQVAGTTTEIAVYNASGTPIIIFDQ